MVITFHEYRYFSNAWLIKISSNGRYLMAPTCTGEVFIYNLKTGQVTGVLKDHDGTRLFLLPPIFLDYSSIMQGLLLTHFFYSLSIAFIDVEVRDVIFHPTRPLLLTSADGK